MAVEPLDGSVAASTDTGTPIRAPRLAVRRILLPVVQALPWLLFAAFLSWSWGVRDLRATIPHYGDMMETVVGTIWWDEALSTGRDPLIYPWNYFPEGWRVASHSAGFIIPLLLLPLHRLGGPVFAVNVAMLASCLLAFLGAYFVARRYLDRLTAMLPALAFTFWSMRWYEAMGGIMQVFLASAFLPWCIWCVERAFRSEHRRDAWLVGGGVVWSIATMIGQYQAVACGVVVAIWILLFHDGTTLSWRRRLASLALVTGSFLVISAPWLALTLRETTLADPSYYSVLEVNANSASLNSLPIPFLYHPWLGPLARLVFRGSPWEASVSNLGFTASVLAVVGAFMALKRRAWWPVLALAMTGLLLTVGMTVHWDAQPVTAPWLRPLALALWRVGHLLKPSFFAQEMPPSPLDSAIPLPGYLLVALVPFLERGRMVSRYGMVAVTAVYMLAGLTISRMPRFWLRLVLGSIVVFALVPPRLEALPWPPKLHPGFVWLSEHLRPGEGILNVVAIHPSTMGTVIGGETLLAAHLHKLPTASGSSGVKPRHALYLETWLATHQHPFWQPDLARILQAYRIRYVAIQMEGDWEPELWREAQVAEEFKTLECFDPVQGGQPWDWPVCVVEVTPRATPGFNVLLHEGWSGMEEWGAWSEATEAKADWIATSKTPARLVATAFPNCRSDTRQRVEIELNGEVLTEHQWLDCEPWSTEVGISGDQVRVGANELVVRSAYAEPAEAGGDTRRLAVGFTTLRIESASPQVHSVPPGEG